MLPLPRCHGPRMRATQLTLPRFRQFPQFAMAGLDPAIQSMCITRTNVSYAQLGGPHSRAMTSKCNVAAIHRCAE